jgi:hypothetical protein
MCHGEGGGGRRNKRSVLGYVSFQKQKLPLTDRGRFQQLDPSIPLAHKRNWSYWAWSRIPVSSWSRYARKRSAAYRQAVQSVTTSIHRYPTASCCDFRLTRDVVYSMFMLCYLQQLSSQSKMLSLFPFVVSRGRNLTLISHLLIVPSLRMYRIFQVKLLHIF